MDLNELIKYVSHTTHNTNPNMLRSMANTLLEKTATEAAEEGYQEGKTAAKVWVGQMTFKNSTQFPVYLEYVGSDGAMHLEQVAGNGAVSSVINMPTYTEEGSAPEVYGYLIVSFKDNSTNTYSYAVSGALGVSGNVEKAMTGSTRTLLKIVAHAFKSSGRITFTVTATCEQGLVDI